MLVGTVALPVTAADCPAAGYDGRENLLGPAEPAKPLAFNQLAATRLAFVDQTYA